MGRNASENSQGKVQKVKTPTIIEFPSCGASTLLSGAQYVSLGDVSFVGQSA